MIDFLWHLRGSVALDGVGSDAEALDRVERLLDQQQKNVSERDLKQIHFDDPLWREPFGPSWPAMGIYDRGRFWVEQGLDGRRLRYDLRSLHGMLFCLFGACTAFLFGFADEGLPGGFKFAVGAFAWLYGMNIFFALTRVPSAIRSAIKAP